MGIIKQIVNNIPIWWEISYSLDVSIVHWLRDKLNHFVRNTRDNINLLLNQWYIIIYIKFTNEQWIFQCNQEVH